MKRLVSLSTLVTLLFASCTTEPFATNMQMDNYFTLPQTRSLTSDDNEPQIYYSIYERYEPQGEPIPIDLPDGNRVYLDPVDSTYFSGDMIFSKEFIEEISTNTNARSAVAANTNLYWPGKVINYMILNSAFNDNERNKIIEALNEISNATHLTFVYNGSAAIQERIIFKRSNVNNTSFSSIGKQSNKPNYIQLAPNTTVKKGTVIHEVLHSLGFFHEHSRTDRNNYITIIEENINPEYLYAFDTFIDKDYSGYNLGTFDFNSIMLYGSFNGFEINPSQPSITRKDGTIFSEQRDSLSYGDIAGLNYIYGPKPILTTTIISAEDNGDLFSRDDHTVYSNIITFVDKNNNPVTLSYPRLLWVHFSSEEIDHLGETTNQSFTTQLTIPAGCSSYTLDNTHDIWQADIGVDRYRYYSTYSLTYY